MIEVRETRLPGVGKKFTMHTTRGEDVCAIVHTDGRREVYHRSDPDEEAEDVLVLTDDEARRKYRGAAIVVGQEYDFPVDPDDPTRVLPFLGYNWRTFGQYLISAIGGFIAFGVGMYLAKQGQALQKKPQI